MTAHAGYYGPEILLDGAGRPLRLANVVILQSNGTTPAVLYGDRSKTSTLASNAVATDSGGNLAFYADPGQYVLRWIVAGVTHTLTVEVGQDFIDQGGAVLSVNGHTAAVTLTAADVGADASGAATSAVTAHTAAPDPHGDRAYTDTQVATRAAATALTAETSRATTAEQANATAIAAETTRAQAAEAAISAGLQFKAARVVATANVASRSGLATIDGVTLSSGDVVLLVAQSSASQNGLWRVASGAWTRPSNYAAGSDASAVSVWVEDGTANKSSVWVVAGSPPNVVDTNVTTWQQASGLGEVVAGTGIVKTGNTLSTDPAVIATIAALAGVQAGALSLVVHGAAGGTARPAGATLVLWIGTATPANAITNDLWYDTGNELQKRWNGTSWKTVGATTYALPRAALPRQRLAGKKTIITTFQAGHGATSGGTGTVNLNDSTSPAITGYSQYVSITTNGAGATATVRKSGIASIDLTAYDLEILVKMDHPESTYIECVTTGTSFTDFYTFPLNDYTLGATTRYMRANELTTLRFSLDTIAPSGASPAKTLNAIQLGVRDNGAQVGRVELYGIYAVPKPNSAAIVTISFDDLYTSQHDFALPLLAQLGFPATVYAIADRTPAQWTIAQLQDAQRLHGIDVSGHAYTKVNHDIGFANLDPVTRAQELRNLRSWSVSNGFSGADHLAYPGGNHDAATEADVAQLFATAVTTENSPLAEIQPAEPMRWRRKLVQAADSVASVQALVDKAVATKSYLHLNFHDLVTSGASGPNYLKADFSTLMNYVAASGARVLTTSDVWRLGA